MAGQTDYLAQALLAHSVGKTAYTLPTTYVGLFSAVGTDAGTGFTEFTIGTGAYARVATAGLWNAASGSDPSTITNSGAITFPTSTTAWGTAVAFGIFDAASAGNLLWWDFLGNDPWFPFTGIASATNTFTAIGITAGSSPALANGASVVFDAEWGGTLPAAITQYTAYTVAGLAADVFNVGVTPATTSSGMVRQVATQVISNNVTFSFASSALTLALT